MRNSDFSESIGVSNLALHNTEELKNVAKT